MTLTLTLTLSQIETLRHVNEKPGRGIHSIGADYAEALRAAGYITVRGERCYPTAAAAPYKGRSAQELRDSKANARAALIGRWGAML